VERWARGLVRPILLVTVAPECPGGETFVRDMAAAGRVVAIGHSAANADAVTGAADAGARLSTHLGNGLPQVLPKVDNTLFAQLAEDRLTASFIADGIHLPPAALKAMLRAKGSDRSILVSDAVSAAAAGPGIYPFAGMLVQHAEDGSVRLPGSRFLAGSALTLDKAVRNLVRWGIATPDRVLSLASDNPRRLMHPALDAFSVRRDPGEVHWSPGLGVREVRLDDRRWRFANEDAMA
jgi:N-acetylglucosamine-6-phosphate deacetylase